uniref:Pre-mRNA-splicing factor SPF27 n=1 Tax=Cercocebus atys TaxID=9531 RepID=A0A2K5LQ48_CERAT
MAGTVLVAGEVVVDAELYFFFSFLGWSYEAPGVQEAAAVLVEKETCRYQPTMNYLSYLTVPNYSAFETDIMRNEFERLALEHQAVRIKNLKLMSQHGCNVWKVYNENLVHMTEHAQKELQKLRKHIKDLNWQRKNMQLTAGSKLRERESNWISMVSKNYEIEQIIAQLENEIYQIKQQHGEANKENIQQDF